MAMSLSLEFEGKKAPDSGVTKSIHMLKGLLVEAKSVQLRT